MARLTRDADAIGEKGLYLKEVCSSLNSEKISFTNNINNMLANYKGVDATSIANTLLDAVNKIDGLIKNLNYFSNYMLAVAKYDNENIESANKKINRKNTMQPQPIITEGGVVNGPEQINY